MVVIGTIYAVQTYRGVSIDGDANGGAPQAVFNLTGSAPRHVDAVQINRNGQVWVQSVTGGKFTAAITLQPGVNHIQASMNGTLSKRIDVNGPSPVSAVEGDCRGTITPTPTFGFNGDPLVTTITIDPSTAAMVDRVVTDNPKCHDCSAVRTSPNTFVLSGPFIGGDGGTFQITFVAYDGQNRARCRGTTVPLTVFTKPK
jgi:hypothetical protein